jgi:hypothetical protein
MFRKSSILTCAALTLSLGAALSSTCGYAQSMAQATIPFDFTVGQTLLPAGTYHIDRVQAGTVSLESGAGDVHMFYPVVPSDYVNKASNRLIFHKYGDQYFLSEIRGSLGGYALTIGTSKLEKGLQQQEAKRQNEQETIVAME